MKYGNAHFEESTWPMDNTCLRRVIIVYNRPWYAIADLLGATTFVCSC